MNTNAAPYSERSWGETLKNYRKSTTSLPWGQNDFVPTKRETVYEKSRKERAFNPVTMTYRDEAKENTIQQREKAFAAVRLNDAKDKQLCFEQKFNIINHQSHLPTEVRRCSGAARSEVTSKGGAVQKIGANGARSEGTKRPNIGRFAPRNLRSLALTLTNLTPCSLFPQYEPGKKKSAMEEVSQRAPDSRVKYNIISHMGRDEHYKAKMVPKEGEEFTLKRSMNVTLEGGMKPKSHQTREFDVLTNKYIANNTAREVEDLENQRDELAKKYWKTHDYDILAVRYCDAQKQQKFEKDLREKER